jgi:histidinol dehydrogenase
MNISFYRWKDTDTKTRSKIMARAQADIASLLPEVLAIIENVRKHGDAALKDYSKRFDKVVPATFKVPEEEFARAKASLPGDLKNAIR